MRPIRIYSLGEQGVVIIFAAITLVLFIAFTALAVDVGHMMVSRTELQRVADAAALAGARTLGRIYQCDGNIATCPRVMPYEDQLDYNAAGDADTIMQAARDIALQNKTAGINITINNSDIVIGNWNGITRILTTTMLSPDAVRVTARRASAANGPITTFFARILGINTVAMSATATAALTGEYNAGRGGLPLPVAINKSWMSTLPCNQNLTFHPSSAGTCSAWNAYDGNTYKTSASSMRKMIDAITAGTYSSPATDIGDSFDFTNGTLASLFNSTCVQNLFNTMRVKNDGILDFDQDPATWTTTIPVYDDTVVGCSPNGPVPIVGFATITITNVSGPPTTTVFAQVKCDNVAPGRGGGGEYGTKGDTPGLVQ
jgi:hypothetical protein